MKEFDFLPEWYKSNKRRSTSYRIQCVILGGVFAIMMVWNFFASASVSRAEAELTHIVAGNTGTQDVTRRFEQLKDQIGKLQKKAAIIEKTDSRIDVASVLAELSYLIEGSTVLSRVELIAEKFIDTTAVARAKGNGEGLVRAVGAKASEEGALPLGKVKFKVVISGVAPNSSDVAALIIRLEDSPYFFQVVPSYSRNAQISRGTAGSQRSSDVEGDNGKAAADIKVTEFEISGYLANYRQE